MQTTKQLIEAVVAMQTEGTPLTAEYVTKEIATFLSYIANNLVVDAKEIPGYLQMAKKVKEELANNSMYTHMHGSNSKKIDNAKMDHLIDVLNRVAAFKEELEAGIELLYGGVGQTDQKRRGPVEESLLDEATKDIEWLEKAKKQVAAMTKEQKAAFRKGLANLLSKKSSK